MPLQLDIFQAVINVSCCIRDVQQSKQIHLWQYLEILWKTAASEILVYGNEHARWLFMVRLLGHPGRTSDNGEITRIKLPEHRTVCQCSHIGAGRKGIEELGFLNEMDHSLWIFISLAKLELCLTLECETKSETYYMLTIPWYYLCHAEPPTLVVET